MKSKILIFFIVIFFISSYCFSKGIIFSPTESDESIENKHTFSTLSLEAIFLDGFEYSCIINNKIYKEFDSIGPFKINSITEEKVTIVDETNQTSTDLVIE